MRVGYRVPEVLGDGRVTRQRSSGHLAEGEAEVDLVVVGILRDGLISESHVFDDEERARDHARACAFTRSLEAAFASPRFRTACARGDLRVSRQTYAGHFAGGGEGEIENTIHVASRLRDGRVAEMHIFDDEASAVAHFDARATAA